MRRRADGVGATIPRGLLKGRKSEAGSVTRTQLSAQCEFRHVRSSPESFRNARRWLDELVLDRRQTIESDGRPREEERALNPHDTAAVLCPSADCRCCCGRPSAPQVQGQATDWICRPYGPTMGRAIGRVGVWRGGVRLSMSVAAPFVWRCLSGSAVAPFPHPPHRTGRADFPHPALGQDLTPSSTARRAQAGSGVRARSARRGARVDSSRPFVA